MQPYYDDGTCTIYHGDCRDMLPGLMADVVITDPPYNLGLRYGEDNDDQRQDYEAWSLSWFSMCPRPLVFTPGTKHLAMWCRIEQPTWVGAWHKPNGAGGTPLRGFAAWEPVLFYGLPPCTVRHDAWSVPLTAQPWGNDRSPPRPGQIRTRGISEIRPGDIRQAQPGRHPCPKPLGFMNRLLQDTSRPGQLILDPFLGSGTTMRAAKTMGRRCIGIEIEERYCEIAARRLGQEVLAL